jgi:hypothetical protein
VLRTMAIARRGLVTWGSSCVWAQQ